MSSSIPFTTQSDADTSKCFKWRKWPLSGPCGTERLKWSEGGANKKYWWVISGKCLQDKNRSTRPVSSFGKELASQLWGRNSILLSVVLLSKEPGTQLMGQLMGQCCYHCDCALCNCVLYHASCSYALCQRLTMHLVWFMCRDCARLSAINKACIGKKKIGEDCKAQKF